MLILLQLTNQAIIHWALKNKIHIKLSLSGLQLRPKEAWGLSPLSSPPPHLHGRPESSSSTPLTSIPSLSDWPFNPALQTSATRLWL